MARPSSAPRPFNGGPTYAIMSRLIMTNPVLNFLALALYLSVGTLLASQLLRGRTIGGGAKIGIFSLGCGAIVLHAVLLYTGLRLESGLNLALTPTFSLVAWIIAVLYLITSLSRPVDNLGVIIMPMASLTVLVDWFWTGHNSLHLPC